MRKAAEILAVFLLAVSAGCVQGVDESDGATTAKSGGATKVAGISFADVNLKTGDGQAFRDMIAAHKGQVVFVDYWATWCEPCIEFFPHTVELNRKYKEQGLATIAVSFDAADAPDVPRNFLARHGVDFENLLSSHDLGPAAFED